MTKRGRDSGVPSSNKKSGPTEVGRIARYPSIAVTGHRMSPVRPKYRWTPAPNGSILLRRSKTASTWGLSLESTLTSATDSVSSVEETLVNSPTLMKPKNPRQHAAQSMTCPMMVGPVTKWYAISGRGLV